MNFHCTLDNLMSLNSLIELSISHKGQGNICMGLVVKCDAYNLEVI